MVDVVKWDKDTIGKNIPDVGLPSIPEIQNALFPDAYVTNDGKIETTPQAWGADPATVIKYEAERGAEQLIEVPKNVILSGVEGLQTLGTAGLDGLKKYLPIIAIGALALFAAKR